MAYSPSTGLTVVAYANLPLLSTIQLQPSATPAVTVSPSPSAVVSASPSPSTDTAPNHNNGNSNTLGRGIGIGTGVTVGAVAVLGASAYVIYRKRRFTNAAAAAEVSSVTSGYTPLDHETDRVV
jgi:hypothetical protein